MNTRIGKVATGAVAALFLVGSLTGCAGRTPPSSFYVLTPSAGAEQVQGGSDLAVGVGPVRLAGYLDRPQITGRTAGNRLNVDEFNRWGGGLDSNITDVMAIDIGAILGSDSVVTHPWNRGIPLDYQVTVDFRRFDVDDSRRVTLVAQWRLFSGDGRQLIDINGDRIVVDVAGEGYGAVVAAKSQALNMLSKQIASAVSAAAASQPAAQ